ncbi:chromosome segregation protein SMC [Frigidibacter albus]|uniref:Chromosome segregation protein SMC n=1 Tax=Frigidibacter albus TaxID=1465486 RepID=A0A6L8VFG3_9RHOB|nr:ATP-binding protein [Frigidibacter albus]MZQ89098.1 chromosome segregation protein SMC [Frigidibacter albus]NBE30845.1 chromosome segregation protein SMC [Frigidibacter albus]GGH51456.1 hypothetical protein GCM10011341_15110 [Frigidibacter albus]
MKLRAITLTNVRRFAGRSAALEAIGDGITVLAECNEFGKSTFFDALHALFFEKHRSSKQAVKSLQPHSGGAPEVAVEVELPAGRFLITKRWLSRPTARVTDAAGRVVAQDDEAEAWIERLMAGGPSGPTGLLWVRQGVAGLEPEGNAAERERLLATRRDLMSSVAGEIDAMTGGRRMDAVLARAGEELALLATGSGRPKTGGAWEKALTEAEALAVREADLARLAAALSGALKDRREAERQRQAIDAAEAQAAREAALRGARAAFKAAEDHAGRVARAAQALRVAELGATGANRDLQALVAQGERLAAAMATQERAAGDLARRREAATAARGDEARAAASLASASGAAVAARTRLQAAQRAELAAAAARRLADLTERLTRAEGFRARQEAAAARAAALTVTAKQVAAAESAATDHARLAAQAEARALVLRFAYDGPGRAMLAGAPVEAPLRLTAAAVLDLPGLGRLTVDPGARAEDDLPARLAAADVALARALAACGAETVGAARARLAEADAAREAARQAGELLASLAPAGLEALRAEAAKAAEVAGGAVEAVEVDLPALEAAQRQAEAAESVATAAAGAVRSAAGVASDALARAEAAEQAAAAAVAAAQAEAAGDHPDRLAAAQAAVAAAQAGLDEAVQAHAALVAAAPDLQTAQAGLERAESAAARAAKESGDLARRVAELDGFIRSQADLGIEEELEEVRGRLTEARARAARREAEVRALTRLREALAAARIAAREAYFGPVRQELAPLLAILHEGADLALDDRSLLPVSLTRDGQPEPLEILSGGTAEQIAILTRLAFARLFARSGQTVPIILDDALVHSDDDRIEAMFTALHRVARDQQILVLTCRQRAFASLGGTRAEVRITAV